MYVVLDGHMQIHSSSMKLHHSSENTTKIRDTVNKIHYCKNLKAAIHVVHLSWYFQLNAGSNVTQPWSWRNWEKLSAFLTYHQSFKQHNGVMFNPRTTTKQHMTDSLCCVTMDEPARSEICINNWIHTPENKQFKGKVIFYTMVARKPTKIQSTAWLEHV
jgi:hypothetical protein